MRDKKIWIFNAGLSFDGNPKWLFMYIIKHRKDITPYWFCYTKESMQYIRKLGFKAYLFQSKQAERIGGKAGVYVVNQRKEVFQKYLDGITVLNLWHGVGCKAIEKNVKSGVLDEGIAKKNIINGKIYQNNELFLVTSPLMERHFTECCSLNRDHIVRNGYPCCCLDEKIETYDHDILRGRNLPDNTKIAVYAPTYREDTLVHFFSDAIPRIEELVECLSEKNMVLIFKMHPKMEKDFQYLNIKKAYLNCPWLIFWDNSNDIYEIFHKIDLAIIDYSSIFYDMIAHGVKHFIRYIFDYEDKEKVRDFVFDYMEMTCGPVCKDFDDLLEALSNYHKVDLDHELCRIKKLFWEYEEGHSLNEIIEQAIEFQPCEESTLPTLYSFDIFDTLIARSTLQPIGVFWYVQEKVSGSLVNFPQYFRDNYFKIRPWCEKDAREYYRKSQLYRNSDKLEISFVQIFEHMKRVYHLTEEQTALLKEWEMEAEYRTSIPIIENIDLLKELVGNGEQVVLISDMYLPEEFIKKLLKKADPVLGQIPLFLSSTCGYQKTTKRLFLEVYHSLNYNFGQWIHYGDNQHADINMPGRLGITTVKIPVKKFNKYENTLISFINTYDAFQVGRMLLDARTGTDEYTDIEMFAFRQVAFYFVPYVNWVIRHALEHGLECLYFISRDGHYLKRIADVIIEERHYAIKTKYIYGSRKVWRIPSQLDSIDEEFWSEFGNFVDITDYEHLLAAAALTEEEFAGMFPSLMYLKNEKVISGETLRMLRETLRSSKEYRNYLLGIAKERRVIVEKYLRQEINFEEKYAFVEFWARGYMQTCLARILWNMQGRSDDNIFYYARSIYPTHGNLIRYNFTGNTFSMIFIETYFANVPYKTVSAYEESGERVEPVIIPCENSMELHEAMERCLPEFARRYVRLNFQEEEAIDRALFDFGLSYFHRHPNDPIWIKFFAGLKDSVSAFGEPIEWAPPRRWKDVVGTICGRKFVTKNHKWSIQRSSKSIKKAYKFYVKHLRGKKVVKKVQRLLTKIADKK